VALYKLKKVPIDNVQFAKRQVKQVSFSHSSERQQEFRIIFRISSGGLFQARTLQRRYY